MAFLSKLHLNKQSKKSLFFCLLPLFGINIKSNFFLCSKLGLNFRVNSFKSDKDFFLLERLEFFISFFCLVDLDLKKNILYNIFLLKSIKSYRGLRHFKKLPLRGQRTKTNSKTVRRVFFSGV